MDIKLNKEISEAVKKLQKLKIDPKEKKKILKKAAKPVLKEAQAKVPKRTENLKKSLGILSFRRSKNAVFVGPRVKSRYKFRGYYGHWVEYGNKHMKAQPYMRPAADAKAQEAIKIITDETAKLLNKTITKVAR